MKKVTLMLGLVFLLIFACQDVTEDMSGQDLFKAGKVYFLKARRENYNKKYFKKANQYLEAAYRKGVSSAELYFMLGTTYNIALKEWRKAVFYLDLARTAYEKTDKRPVEYWKTLYNLGHSLLLLKNVSENHVQLSIKYLHQIRDLNLKKQTIYSDLEKDEIYRLQELAKQMLSDIRRQSIKQ